MMASTRPGSRRRTDEVQFRLIYIATLPVFLMAALFGRALPVRHERPGVSGLTILGRARAAASTCGSFALMG